MRGENYCQATQTMISKPNKATRCKHLFFKKVRQLSIYVVLARRVFMRPFIGGRGVGAQGLIQGKPLLEG